MARDLTDLQNPTCKHSSLGGTKRHPFGNYATKSVRQSKRTREMTDLKPHKKPKEKTSGKSSEHRKCQLDSDLRKSEFDLRRREGPVNRQFGESAQERCQSRG